MADFDESPSRDEAQLEWLQECDEALAQGRPVPGPGPRDEPAERTRRRVELLRRLDQFRPHHRPSMTTTIDDSSGSALSPSPLGQDGELRSPTWDKAEAAGPRELPSVGDYELLEPIAEGGMGIVYEARQISLNRIVAVKMIRMRPWVSRDDLRRFQREAEAAAQLDHPNIVPVYEVGLLSDQPFFSMKRMEGGNLEDRVGQSLDDPRAAVRLLVPVIQAVHHAHQHGILHRDLKPANVLLDGDGRPYVADFGLARAIGRESTLTHEGSIVGTPSYMPPEQAKGSPGSATIAADVYSLGAILFAMLTGRPPFKAATPVETLRQVIDEEPSPPRKLNAWIDRDLEAICLMALHKEPGRRYASAAALADDLDQWLACKPIRARRIGRPERVSKWARRRPAIAGLSGLVVIIAAAGLIGMFVLYGQAVVARSHAVAQSERTLEALGRAEASLYTNRIALADRYRTAHDPDRANDLLDECPVPLRSWEWNYLKRRSVEDVLVHGDRLGRIYALAISPDDRFLVSVDDSSMIHVRDRATCRVLEVPGLPGHKWAVALSPDGQWMAAGGETGIQKTGVVKLWSTRTWSEVKTLPFIGDIANALAFSPDSQRLVAGHDDDMVRVWDIATGTLRTLAGHKKAVRDVAFSPDGRLIASASWDMTIRIWDAETGMLRATLSHQRPVASLAFHPGGRMLATSTGDIVDSSRCELSIWDLELARIVRRTPALASIIWNLRFSPDGRRLATAGWDNVVRIWDSASLEELLPLTGHAGRVWCVAFSRDGNELASGAGDGLRWWSGAPLPDRPAQKATLTIKAHDKAIYALGLTPDGRHLVSGGEDYTAHVWDLETGRDLLTYRKHKFAVYTVAVRPDGLAVATGGDDQVIRIWDPRTGADIRQLRGHTGSITSLAFHPDGIRLASASQDSTVRLWDTRTGAQLVGFELPRSWMNTLVFSPDGNRLASGGDNPDVRVWDLANRELTHVLRGHTERVVSLAFHPDSLMLASSSLDGTVRMWRAEAGVEQRRFDGVRGRGLAWSPGGQHFAVSGSGGSLRVWEVASGRCVLTLRGHGDDITSALYSPDGRQLVTAGWDGTIRAWKTTPDVADQWSGESHRLLGHATPVARVAVLPDGKRAVSGGDDGTIRVWEIASGRELRRWVGSSPRIQSLAVTPDGKRVLVGGLDPQIRVWDIDSGREVQQLQTRGECVWAIAVTPDGRQATSGGGIFLDRANIYKSGTDLDLHLWDLETGAEVRRFAGHRGGITCAAISPMGRRGASGSVDGTVRVWDLDSGAEIRRFDPHLGTWVNAVAFLRDGKRVLVASGYHLILWDLDTGAEIRRFPALRGPVCGLAIAPDGRRALSAGIDDHQLRLWDLATGRELYHYEVLHVGLTRGTFTVDGRQVIWPAFDGVLRVWDLPEQFTGGALIDEQESRAPL